MASIRLSLSKRIDARGKSEILMRFIQGKEHIYRLKTHIYINPEKWDADEEKVIIRRLGTPEQRELVEIKGQIEELTNYLLDEFVRADKSLVDTGWMQDAIERWWHPESVDAEFLETYKKFIEERRLSDMRREQFWVLYRLLGRFERVRGRRVMFQEIDADFLHELEKFISEEHVIAGMKKYRKIYEGMEVKTYPKERSMNTVAGIMKKFRVFIKDCVKNKIIREDPFMEYQVAPEIYGTPYFLTIEERNTIWRCDLSDRPYLAIQRDIFIFQCLTGPRYGDLKCFRKSDIVDDVLEYIPHKTQENESIGLVRVPLTEMAREIVSRYSCLMGEKLFPFISMEKYNESLKEIFIAAGVDRMVSVLDPRTRREVKKPLYELASSHIARRTFVGNLYKQVKDQNLISSMSGHAEGSRAFARYRTIDMDIKRDIIGLLDREEDKQ